MKALHFLFYCLYRVFKLIKRENVRDENLASSFLSILLSTNIVMLSLFLRFIIPKGFFTPKPFAFLLKMIFISLLIGLYYACNNYFITRKKDIEIIKSYESVSAKKYLFIISGITYVFGTFLSFICLALFLSKY